jgi:hypothetical protein
MDSTAATLKPELLEKLMKLTKSPADLSDRRASSTV